MESMHEHHPPHSEHETDCSMKMLFHFTDCEKILFDGWNTNALWKFILSCIGIFLIALVYEGFKFVRERYLLKQINIDTKGCVQNCTKQTFKENVLDKEHAIQTLLHLLQLTVGYCLMLVAMTFNLWLFISIVLGSTLGYFLLNWMRQKQLDISIFDSLSLSQKIIPYIKKTFFAHP